METFEYLKTCRKVAHSAVGIPLRSNSVIFKLQNARIHLLSVLSIKEWIVPTQSNMTTGASIATASSIPPPLISPTAYSISGSLDVFFGSLVSAFDCFSHVINLVYFTHPLPERQVTLNRIARELTRSRRTEGITQNLLSLRQNQWYVDLKLFRHCEEHNKIIQCQVITIHSITETSPYSLEKILIPDNPFDDSPTYHKNRGKRFLEDIFMNSLTAIDEMYRVIENRIRTANKVPV